MNINDDSVLDMLNILIVSEEASSNKNLDRSISSSDIELANKINVLKESGLI